MGKEVRSGKFSSVINLIEAKYGSRLLWQDKQDLRQEAEIALLEAQKNYPSIQAKLAYRIIENRILDWLRERPPKMDCIDDPGTIRKIDKQVVHFPDEDTRLDAEKAVDFANRLAEPYQTVICGSFGYYPKSDEELAKEFNKSEDWVVRTRKRGLQMLRSMMERK